MSESNPKISIIDYGLGNLYSVKKAFEKFSDNAAITEEPEAIRSSAAIVLPGVGAFELGMKGIELRGLGDAIKEFAGSGKPMLGICLGAQIMLTKGYEFGDFNGLDLIPGKVVPFPKLISGTKMPHIGWNKIYGSDNSWNDTIFGSIKQNDDVYFVHSFILEPSNKENILALAEYGGHEFCSAIKMGNIYGCQFHPEKSGETGLKIIEDFINLICKIS